MEGSVSTGATSTTRSRVHGLDEQLSSLGKATESLLRTARLDTALLASGEEELRATVAELEERWGRLERMVEEERRAEQQEDGSAGSDSESGPSHTEQGRRGQTTRWSSDAARRLSRLDWDSERPSFMSNLSDASGASCSEKDEGESAKEGGPWWRFGNKREAEQVEQSQADATEDGQSQDRRRSENSVGSAFAKLFSPKRPPDVDQSSSEPSMDEKRTSELEESAALRLKLKTRDSAAESLHELVMMQVCR